MKAIQGESLPLPAKKAQRKVDTLSSYSDFLWMGFILVPIVGMFLRGVVGRFFGAGLTSGVTGLAAWLIFGSLAFGLVAAVMALLFTLFAGSGAGRGARSGGWIPGGGFGGGARRWRRVQRGGGGGFDGGGSSGSW